MVKDCNGSVVASLSEQAPLLFSPEIVEAMATARAIQFAQELGFSPYILEGDAEVVINTLKSDESLSSFGQIIPLAKSSLVTNSCISFSYVHRVGNKITHNLARHARHVRGSSV